MLVGTLNTCTGLCVSVLFSVCACLFLGDISMKLVQPMACAKSDVIQDGNEME